MGQGACIVQEGQQGKTERQHPVTGVCPEVRESQPWLDAFASSGTEGIDLIKVIIFCEIISCEIIWLEILLRRGQGGRSVTSVPVRALPEEGSSIG
ncbi:hypothetical protein HH141_004543 [Escherichia coli]|nr:hypothetical protein [Escherichia coli]EFI4169791.1 hypothetical protein [Escherichia coli]EFI8569665.1 hypothetical protein [Escherichia coli]EFJ4015743.1 hypothetical protein [Escherichia coli]